MQRQKLPLSASLISSSVGWGLALSKDFTAMMMPGVLTLDYLARNPDLGANAPEEAEDVAAE